MNQPTIISDHAQAVDQLTQSTQSFPIQTQAPRPTGFMDFSRLDLAIQTSQMIAKAPGFCPSTFLGKPEQILCAIQYGLEIGLSPMQALQSIAVINGKPSIYGDGLMALCRSFSECEDIQETFDEATMTATCRVKRKGMSEVVSTYSKKNAEEAKLWGKKGHNGQDTPWITYPRRMLQMRARGFALRDAFADRLKGIITAEEARDYPVQEERQLKVVTPINQNVKAIQHQPNREIEIKEVPENKETIEQLKFIVNRAKVEQERINKWLCAAKVDNLSKLNEAQAQRLIHQLCKEDSTAQRAWILHKKTQNVYQGVEKQMPHGFFTDFTPEQCEAVLEGVAYA